MSAVEWLRALRAAHAARVQYGKAADRWFRVAYARSRRNDPRAESTAILARRIRRAAGNEYDGQRSAH